MSKRYLELAFPVEITLPTTESDRQLLESHAGNLQTSPEQLIIDGLTKVERLQDYRKDMTRHMAAVGHYENQEQEKLTPLVMQLPKQHVVKARALMSKDREHTADDFWRYVLSQSISVAWLAQHRQNNQI